MARIPILLAAVLSSIFVQAGTASALPCSGQLPNGGSFDLGTACHNNWAVVDEEADEVVALANQLIDNTEQFAGQVVTIVCGTVSCP